MATSSHSLNQKKHTLFYFSEQADEFHNSMDYMLNTQV